MYIIYLFICLFTWYWTNNSCVAKNLLMHLFPETLATIQPPHPTVAASRALFSFGKASLKASLALHWLQVTCWCWWYHHRRCDHQQQHHHNQHFHVLAKRGHIERGNQTGSTRTQWKLDIYIHIYIYYIYIYYIYVCKYIYTIWNRNLVRPSMFIVISILNPIRPPMETPMIYLSFIHDFAIWPSFNETPLASLESESFPWAIGDLRLHCPDFTHTKSINIYYAFVVEYALFLGFCSHGFFIWLYGVPHIVGLTFLFILCFGWRWLSSHFWIEYVPHVFEKNVAHPAKKGT